MLSRFIDLGAVIVPEPVVPGAILVVPRSGVPLVFADLIVMAPPNEQSTLMADVLANLAVFYLRRRNPPTQLIHAIQATDLNAVRPRSNWFAHKLGVAGGGTVGQP